MPARNRLIASFTRDIGNDSVTGAMPWRAQKSSIVIVVAGLPTGARDVEVVAAPQRVRARVVKPGIRRAQLVAPAPGPLTLTVEFTLRGHRYQVAGGVIFVTVGTSVQ